MLDLKKLKAEKSPNAPRLVLYGEPKIGKSTFAASIPDALFIDIEGGSENLEVARVKRDQMPAYSDFLGVLDSVLTQEHKFSALVIDSADFLERNLMMPAVAKEHNASEFGKIGYGRGEVSLGAYWRQVCARLDEIRETRGMAIILLAHDSLKKESLPNQDAFDRFTLALSKHSIEYLEAWSDAILFVQNEVDTMKRKDGLKEKTVATTGERAMHTVSSPSFLAGNRYGLPAQIPFPHKGAWAVFLKEFEKSTK